MSKLKVLQKLSQHKEGFLSGEAISKELGISRAAIWKNIKALREDGYIINSSTNGGYFLAESPDIITEFELRKGLKDHLREIYIYDSITSTNTKAKHLADDGAKSGTILMANEQTAGRGRFNRNFQSPKNKGIYLSVIYRLNATPTQASLITVASSLAVCRAIESVCPIKPTIKWTNDILMSNKKLCGILTEVSVEAETGSIQYVIIGIGINVNNHSEDFLPELKDTATSLYIEAKKEINRSLLASSILNELDFLIKDNYFLSHKEKIIEQYRQRLCMLGKNIKISRGNEIKEALALDIDENAALIVQYENGAMEAINSGEISIKLGENQ